MCMTDPIADMLSSIRNASTARHDMLTVPASKIKAEMAALLAQEGYIGAFKILRQGVQGKIAIKLKYIDGKPAIRGIKRISTPGRRVYMSSDELKPVLSGTGAAILSTNKGILTDAEAREAKVGGEVLCHIW
ncbi:MAG: 30S ribosomal protein S8 [Nitrospinota bacterium]|nr:30S ribosomal protein S8 [Nitrospinota bacterium]MDH5678068.1 30S ribosomal protein S8 [Nitrospinota bacterium]MDH5755548.1 30S ribosomal protein S8 [Nitrospinota bacterium]